MAIGSLECDFKMCDLCGPLNQEDGGECFFCSWTETVYSDPDSISAELSESGLKRGEFGASFSEEEMPSDERRRRGVVANLVERMRRYLTR